MANFAVDPLPAIVLDAYNIQLWQTLVQERLDDDILVVCVPNTHHCPNQATFQLLYQGSVHDKQLVIFDLGIGETLAGIVREQPNWDSKILWGRCLSCNQNFPDVPLNIWN